MSPPGGTILKARLASQGGTTQKIASILIASTSRTTPRGETLKARLGSERGGKPSDAGGQVAVVSCTGRSVIILVSPQKMTARFFSERDSFLVWKRFSRRVEKCLLVWRFVHSGAS